MYFSEGIKGKFSGLCVAEGIVEGVSIRDADPGLEGYKLEVARDIKGRLALDAVKFDPGFRAYRDYFWSVGIDPTKTRPASEALVRRMLSGGSLPKINTAVDAYNLASATSGVPIAAFDADRIRPPLTMRFAAEGEPFRGIGMKEALALKPNQVIVADEEKIIAVYPYRDSEETKVTSSTKSIYIVSCGVPAISPEKVLTAYEACVAIICRYSGGTHSSPQLSII